MHIIRSVLEQVSGIVVVLQQLPQALRIHGASELLWLPSTRSSICLSTWQSVERPISQTVRPILGENHGATLHRKRQQISGMDAVNGNLLGTWALMITTSELIMCEFGLCNNNAFNCTGINFCGKFGVLYFLFFFFFNFLVLFGFG